ARVARQEHDAVAAVSARQLAALAVDEARRLARRAEVVLRLLDLGLRRRFAAARLVGGTGVPGGRGRRVAPTGQAGERVDHLGADPARHAAAAVEPAAPELEPGAERLRQHPALVPAALRPA